MPQNLAMSSTSEGMEVAAALSALTPSLLSLSLVLLTGLYLFAGKQTFLLMLLTDPDGARCPLIAAYRDRHSNTAFMVTFGFFLAVWPALFLWAALSSPPRPCATRFNAK